MNTGVEHTFIERLSKGSGLRTLNPEGEDRLRAVQGHVRSLCMFQSDLQWRVHVVTGWNEICLSEPQSSLDAPPL